MDENGVLGRSQTSRAFYASSLGTPEFGVSDPRKRFIVSRRVCCYMILLPSVSNNTTQGVHQPFGVEAGFDNDEVSSPNNPSHHRDSISMWRRAFLALTLDLVELQRETRASDARHVKDWNW